VGEGGDEVSVARFIADQRTFYRVPYAVCCAILGISISWLYKWLARPVTPREQRRGELDAEVGRLFVESGRSYGSPRVHADLLEAGWAVSVNTVADSMRRQGLQGRKPKQQGVDEAGPLGAEVPGPAQAGLQRPGTEREVVRGHDRDPHR
jgi:hypothetical protein